MFWHAIVTLNTDMSTKMTASWGLSFIFQTFDILQKDLILRTTLAFETAYSNTVLLEVLTQNNDLNADCPTSLTVRRGFDIT